MIPKHLYDVRSYDSEGNEHDHYGDLTLSRANIIFDNLGLGVRLVSQLTEASVGKPVLTLVSKVIERVVIEEIDVQGDEYEYVVVKEKSQA